MKNFRHQHHRPKKSTLIVGRAAVLEALQTGRQLERIYMQSTLQASAVEDIKKLAASVLVPIHKVPVEKLNNFNVSNHEGCIAEIAKVQYQDLQQVISFVIEEGKTPLLLILDGITDIRNIGGIARSAYAMGVHALIIPAKGVGTLNEDALLTSAGALENLAVCRVQSLMKTVEDLHLNGILVYATEMTATKKCAEVDFTIPCALVMGGEENGIQPSLLKICDEQFHIPMPGQFESLNVSVATGMALYEAVRQRG